MRIPAPAVPLVAYCWICDRTLLDPATGAAVTVRPPSIRQGVCTECRTETGAKPGPTQPTGTTASAWTPAGWPLEAAGSPVKG